MVVRNYAVTATIKILGVVQTVSYCIWDLQGTSIKANAKLTASKPTHPKCGGNECPANLTSHCCGNEGGTGCDPAQDPIQPGGGTKGGGDKGGGK